MYLHLTSDNGGSGDNYTYTRFDQSASAAITAGAAPFNGNYRPEGGAITWRPTTPALPGAALTNLDSLNGTNANGNWTLIIDDDASGDTGTLNYWSLEVNGAVDPNGPSTRTNPAGTGTANPIVVINDGSGATTLKVTVVPGTNPPSTGLGVTVNGASIGAGTITLLDNGVAPDTVAGDNIFAGNATVASGTAAGVATLPFTITDSYPRTGSGNISLTIATTPAPTCPAGVATLSFTNASGNGPVGDAANSIFTGDFGYAGSIYELHMSGRMISYALYNTEARVQATAPDGTIYAIQPFPTGTQTSPRDLTDLSVPLPGGEAGTGTWTFQFYETYNDTATPDVTWSNVCFSGVSSTSPTGTGLATPNSVLNDGASSTVLAVTVTPGTIPDSTFLTTGSVTVNGTSIGAGTVTLYDNGVAPDLVAGDFIFSGTATVASGTTAGPATLPFSIIDDQSRSASGSIALTVTSAPPGCPSGAAALSFTNVSSDGIVGDPDNSIATGDFGLAGDINVLRIAGRLISNGTPYNTETRIQATSPDGTIFLIQPFPTGTSVSPRDLIGFTYTLATTEPGAGTWTFQFYESYDDGVTPDATWSTICFAADQTQTNPTATGVATPNTGVNDGTGSTVLKVTVNPGQYPTSSFLTTGSVTVNASTIGAGTVTLLDNGVAPDAVAGDFIFSANATVANGTAAGAATLPFTVIDDQGRSAAAGNIAFTVTTPPPACPAGQATLTFANVSSDGAVGDPDNSIVTGDFGFGDYVNVIRMSGRLVSNGTPYNLEARVQATTPDGHIYQFQPFTTTPSTSPRDLATATFNLTSLESGVGTWTFEFFESINDSQTPDATWTSACFGIDQAATSLAATGAAAPTTVVRDGVATTTLKVTVAPGHFPESTGIAVVVNDSSIGGSGSLTLLDDGVFPDVAMNDNIFTANTTVAYTTALGTATLPYTVTDAESGSATGNINFTVGEASGACCTGSGCIVTTIGDCLDVQGGTFAGTGTACTAPTAFSTDGAGAFEDISATGTAIAFTDGTDPETDDGYFTIPLPFTFNYFGNDYTAVTAVTNGFLEFTGTSVTFSNGTIPSAGVPNDAIYALWDDLNLFGTGSAFYQTLGTVGVDARFIVQWSAGQYNGFDVAPADLSTFQVALFEDGSIELRYQTVSTEQGSAGTGDTSTFGIENSTGTLAVNLGQTRATLAALAPISYRGNSTMNDTGVCGNGCAPCAADFDNNGGIDGADLSAFFAAYEAGETCGDVDQNGGIDGADLSYFFSVYEAGGC